MTVRFGDSHCTLFEESDTLYEMTYLPASARFTLDQSGPNLASILLLLVWSPNLRVSRSLMPHRYVSVRPSDE